MTQVKEKRTLWYTRRDGVVRGPYPEKQISRYILLGRIRDTDELRPGDGGWGPVSGYPDVIPEVMKLPPTEENRQKLLIARMHEDERRPGNRRMGAAANVQERRSGPERRRAEAPELIRHRDLRHRVSHSSEQAGKLYRYPLAFSLLVVFGFLLSYQLQRSEPDIVPPDCAASPRPGVNWNHCNLVGLSSERADLLGARVRNAALDAAQLVHARLAGADLEYTSLNLSNLQAADLSRANLRGVALRGSDLRNAKLVEANLSYANLSGARLEGADFSGAILDYAIWTDQKPCAAGSVGVCKRQSGQEVSLQHR